MWQYLPIIIRTLTRAATTRIHHQKRMRNLSLRSRRSTHKWVYHTIRGATILSRDWFPKIKGGSSKVDLTSIFHILHLGLLPWDFQVKGWKLCTEIRWKMCSTSLGKNMLGFIKYIICALNVVTQIGVLIMWAKTLDLMTIIPHNSIWFTDSVRTWTSGCVWTRETSWLSIARRAKAAPVWWFVAISSIVVYSRLPKRHLCSMEKFEHLMAKEWPSQVRSDMYTIMKSSLSLREKKHHFETSLKCP